MCVCVGVCVCVCLYVCVSPCLSSTEFGWKANFFLPTKFLVIHEGKLRYKADSLCSPIHPFDHHKTLKQQYGVLHSLNKCSKGKGEGRAVNLIWASKSLEIDKIRKKLAL